MKFENLTVSNFGDAILRFRSDESDWNLPRDDVRHLYFHDLDEAENALQDALTALAKAKEREAGTEAKS